VDNDSQWTFTQLAAAIDNVRALLGRAAVTSDDAVLILAPLRNQAVAAYLGTVYHGAVAVLIDRRSGPSDVIHACNAARPTVALAFDDDAQRLGLAQQCPVISLGRVNTDIPPPVSGNHALVDPDLPAVVVFTSGTTSMPKGVVHTLNSLRSGTANMIGALDVDADDAFYLSGPLANITGVLQLDSALTSHAKLILDERFSAASAFERINRHGATIIGGAPVVVETLFAEAERRSTSLPLRCIAVGGTMIPQRVIDNAARFGIRSVRVYGSSEVPFSTATSPIDAQAMVDDGSPLPGVEVAILDSGGTDELIVRGPHQFHGYLDTTHNSGAFADDWVRTGDQADASNGRIKIKGRLKEIVVRKGMKISLAEIDSAAAGLGDCAAFGVDDEVTGERLALAIRTTGAPDITFADVVKHLAAGGLAKWKLPEQIVLWDDTFPRTASGKVIRQQLANDSRDHRTLYAPRKDDKA
jgi:acyl-CoA synthetase (AMP-forming)/AMP-acid ligase II